MKIRIINKKIKKDVLLNLWMNSMDEWSNVDVKDKNLRLPSLKLAQQMYEYDISQLCKRALRLGIKKKFIRYFYLYKRPFVTQT